MKIPSGWIIGGCVVLAVLILLGGLGWRAGYFKQLLANEKVEHFETGQESGLKDVLIEGQEAYHEESRRRSDRVDQIIDDVRSEGLPNDDPSDSPLARARRSDAAWRRGVVELCPDCAPVSMDDPDQRPPEGMSGSEAE